MGIGPYTFTPIRLFTYIRETTIDREPINPRFEETPSLKNKIISVFVLFTFIKCLDFKKIIFFLKLLLKSYEYFLIA